MKLAEQLNKKYEEEEEWTEDDAAYFDDDNISRIWDRVYNKIDIKAPQKQAELWKAMAETLSSTLEGMPRGQVTLKKILKDFIKEKM